MKLTDLITVEQLFAADKEGTEDDPDIPKRASAWLRAGGAIYCEGWAKRGARGKRKTWQSKIVMISFGGGIKTCCERIAVALSNLGERGEDGAVGIQRPLRAEDREWR